MSAKDTITKEYMRNAEIFADAFNFLMYDGEQVIKPESLKELDTTAIALPYGDDEKIIPLQKYRDLLKMVTAKEYDNVVYLILGLENQSDINYAMPVKNGLYDMINYAEQVVNAAKSHRKARNSGESKQEFLSGFHKTDKLVPVVTLVVYFGADKWDAPRTLHEMMFVKDERVLAFSPDYKINLIAPEELSDEELGKFHSDLSLALKYIKYSKDKEGLKKLLYEDKAFQSVPRDTANVIKVITNSRFKIDDGKERINVCKAEEDMMLESKAEGKVEVIKNLLQKDFELEEALELAGIDKDTYDKYTK